LLDAGQATTGGARNVFGTLANHPGLFKHYVPFAGKLLTRGKIDAVDRELVILRCACVCECTYEWVQHSRIARQVGFTNERLAAVRIGCDDAAWSPRERALLRATDSLVQRQRVDLDTWTQLSEHYADDQLIELVMLVGNYVMLAGLLNSVGVQVESEHIAVVD
jgi:4-carboxymuconolactone decarboxylase